jgi:hypothetical protein
VRAREREREVGREKQRGGEREERPGTGLCRFDLSEQVMGLTAKSFQLFLSQVRMVSTALKRVLSSFFPISLFFFDFLVFLPHFGNMACPRPHTGTAVQPKWTELFSGHQLIDHGEILNEGKRPGGQTFRG